MKDEECHGGICSFPPGFDFFGVCSQRTGKCDGDCDGNGAVTINELVMAVTIALGQSDVSMCASADMNSSGGVEVNELVAAVGAALDGCSA